MVPPSEATIRILMQNYIPPGNDLRLMLQRAMLNNSIALLSNQRPALKCRAGIVDGVVYPNGDVALCEITNPFDNLQHYEYDFYRLWLSAKAQEARKIIQNCACMHGCHMVNAMKYDYRFVLDALQR